MAAAPAHPLIPGNFARSKPGNVMVRLVRGPKIHDSGIWTVQDSDGSEWLTWGHRLEPVALTDEEAAVWIIASLSN